MQACYFSNGQLTSLLSTKGDYEFANKLNRNLKDLTDAVNKLAESGGNNTETESTPGRPLKYEIPVRGGALIVKKSIYPDSPGVYVSYRPEGCQDDIDLVLVENTDVTLRREKDADEKDLRIFIWDNPYQKDYTNEYVFSGKEAAKAVQEAEA